MKRSKFSEEQIVYAIRQADAGSPIGDLCRQLGVSDATFYAWKQKYAHLGVSELRRLRQLEEENSRLKRLVAGLSLDKRRLSEALRKQVYGLPAAGSLPRGFRRPFRSVACGPVAWPSSVGPPGIGAVGRGINRPCACGFITSSVPGPVWVPAHRVLLWWEGWLVNRKRARQLYRL
jgi:putative transposase